MSQGKINGFITKHYRWPEVIKKFLEDKTPEQIEQARSHWKTINALHKKAEDANRNRRKRR